MTAIEVSRPSGSLVAVQEHPEITVDFTGDDVALKTTIGPGKTDVQQFSVLLPDDGPRGRHLQLQLTLSMDSPTPRVLRRAIKVAIPD